MKSFLVLKYPVKIANKLWPKGTKVRQAVYSEVKKEWKDMRMYTESDFVAVWFPGVENITLLHRKQIKE